MLTSVSVALVGDDRVTGVDVDGDMESPAEPDLAGLGGHREQFNVRMTRVLLRARWGRGRTGHIPVRRLGDISAGQLGLDYPGHGVKFI